MNNHIFEKVDEYLSDLFQLEDEVLQKTLQSIIDHGMPEHSVSATQGQFLFLLANLCQATRIIEVGTLGGYSTIWLGRALDNQGKLTTIEIDPKCAEVARNNIKNAGLEDLVEVITGDALETLSQIQDSNEKVDLFFMDADKPNYINYFNWALENSRKGTLIIADNVIREGKVLDKGSQDEKVTGVQAYNSMIAQNDQVTNSVLPLIGIKGYDGLAISMVK